MPHNHPAVAALPTVGQANKTLIRNMSVAKFPYCADDAEDIRDFVAIDPATGATTIDILLFGRTFHYDPTDLITAHDGITCLVSFDGLRYKLNDGSDVFAYAVINNTFTAPPTSPGPSIQDAYLVAAGATGAWAGKSNYIATYTRRGWEFINFSIGRFIYVESIDTYYHKNAGGAWVTGFGNQVTTPNSVPLSAAINFGKRVLVENQTTTAPPGSPVVPTAYIIGPAATGAWSGLDGRIAICEVAGSFVIYNPTNGWSAYDKARSGEFNYNGTIWRSSIGPIVDRAVAENVLNQPIGTPNFLINDTIPLISAGTQILSVSITPKSATNKLSVRVSITGAVNTAGSYMIAAVFQDSIAVAKKANAVYCASANNLVTLNFEFDYVPGTTSPITLTVRAAAHTGAMYLNGVGSGRLLGASSACTITVEEIAA